MPSDAAMKVWLECLAAIGIEGPGLLSADKQAAEVIERAIADAVAQERARIARALRLYPEWCRNWGIDHNMNVATQAANECADMLSHMPAELPEDDGEAAKAIFKTLPWWIEANARTNTLRGDHKENPDD